MNQDVISKFISKDRLSSYGNLQEYGENLVLSKKLYIPLAVFEVALRNSIDAHFSKEVGENWLYDNEFLQKDTLLSINKATAKLLKNKQETPSKGQIIAELNFGFWTSLFKAPYAKQWRTKHLKQVFPNMPTKKVEVITRDKIFKDLDFIRNSRNRIFHYEKIINKQEFIDVEVVLYKLLNYFDKDLESFVENINNAA